MQSSWSGTRMVTDPWFIQYDAFTTSLQNGLRGLHNEVVRTCWAALVCERMLPNYAEFQRRAGWGDVGPLRRSLDRIWLHVVGDRLTETEGKDLRGQFLAVTPHSYQFGEAELGCFVGVAQDASGVIDSCLSYIQTSDEKAITSIGLSAIGSVDAFVNYLDTVQRKDEIVTHGSKMIIDFQLRGSDEDKRMQSWLHPLAIEERRNQLGDIEILSQNGELISEVALAYRAAVMPWRLSNLGFAM